jgi:DNA processing protein
MSGIFPHNSAAPRSTMGVMAANFSDFGGPLRANFFVEATASNFPSRLADLKTPPRGLWVRGRLPGAGPALLAIVGSRSTTLASCKRVESLAAALAGVDIPVISGGALGIDAAAHRGALQAGGVTYAVLGCGIDVVYPDRHVRLFDDIAVRGGLLSEYGPGVGPRAGQFPARNRLVAALADAILVGECRPGSGALITARLGRRLGRRLLALPGSLGTDQLLESGAATAVNSVADVRAALAGAVPAPRSGRGPLSFAFSCSGGGARGFDDLRQALLLFLLEGAATAEALALKLHRPLGEVLGVLSEAELNGRVRRLPGGRFEVPRGN